MVSLSSHSQNIMPEDSLRARKLCMVRVVRKKERRGRMRKNAIQMRRIWSYLSLLEQVIRLLSKLVVENLSHGQKLQASVWPIIAHLFSTSPLHLSPAPVLFLGPKVLPTFQPTQNAHFQAHQNSPLSFAKPSGKQGFPLLEFQVLSINQSHCPLTPTSRFVWKDRVMFINVKIQVCVWFCRCWIEVSQWGWERWKRGFATCCWEWDSYNIPSHAYLQIWWISKRIQQKWRGIERSQRIFGAACQESQDWAERDWHLARKHKRHIHAYLTRTKYVGSFAAFVSDRKSSGRTEWILKILQNH